MRWPYRTDGGNHPLESGGHVLADAEEMLEHDDISSGCLTLLVQSIEPHEIIESALDRLKRPRSLVGDGYYELSVIPHPRQFVLGSWMNLRPQENGFTSTRLTSSFAALGA